MDKIGFITTER